MCALMMCRSMYQVYSPPSAFNVIPKIKFIFDKSCLKSKKLESFVKLIIQFVLLIPSDSIILDEFDENRKECVIKVGEESQTFIWNYSGTFCEFVKLDDYTFDDPDTEDDADPLRISDDVPAQVVRSKIPETSPYIQSTHGSTPVLQLLCRLVNQL